MVDAGFAGASIGHWPWVTNSGTLLVKCVDFDYVFAIACITFVLEG